MRPDVVLINDTPGTRAVTFVELTCPAESNIYNAEKYKKQKYNSCTQDTAPLMDKVHHNGWSAQLICVQVGHLGLVDHSSFEPLWQLLSLGEAKAKNAKSEMAHVAAVASSLLWQYRAHREWSDPPLLNLRKGEPPTPAWDKDVKRRRQSTFTPYATLLA
jgi:hypothetical protein